MPNLPPMLSDEDLAVLERDRIVCVDDAIVARAITTAAMEVQIMYDQGTLRTDSNDVCNPQVRLEVHG